MAEEEKTTSKSTEAKSNDETKKASAEQKPKPATNNSEKTSDKAAKRQKAARRKTIGKLGTALILIGVTFAFIVGFLVVLSLDSRIDLTAARAPADEFVEELFEGDAQTAYDLFNSTAQGATDFERFDSAAVALKELFTEAPEYSSSAHANTAGNVDVANISYRAQGSDLEFYTFVVSVGEVNDNLVVLNFNSTPDSLR